MTRRPKTGLSSEDSALWDHVTKNVTRIEKRKRMTRPVSEVADIDPSSKRAKSSPPSAKPIPQAPPNLVHRTPVPARTPALAAIEPRKAKRIARGRDEIEARIDLHGMRQGEAHDTLQGFLLRAYHQGLRMVLVITGKGRPNEEPHDAPFDMFQDRDRGVLRRNVPRWLSQSELRAIVVGYTNAHARHGGDGAFYVQLRNREKHRS